MDETGQDTGGKLFFVVVIIKESKDLVSLERSLEDIETKSGKRKFKWRKTSKEIKKKYLSGLLQTKGIKNSVYFSKFENTREYTVLTSLTIAKTILMQDIKEPIVTIIIDGLNDKERENVSKELKKLKIRYRKIRGMKDEQNILLRLADAFAGFLREYYEKETYTHQFFNRFRRSDFISKI